MKWTNVVLVVAVVVGVVLGVMAVKPGSVTVNEFREFANVRVSESVEIPFVREFPITGLAISGSWEGPGFAQVVLQGDGSEHLVLDTRSLQETIEFSAFGTQFYAACADTCKIPPFTPERLLIFISGPGFLSIDTYHFAVPLGPSGLSVCPNCRTVRQSKTPDHSMLLLVITLVVSVIGAHALSHFCQKAYLKRALIIVFLGAFIVLGGIFGVSFAEPTAAVTLVAKKAATVFAALGMVALFAVAGIEAVSVQHNSEQPKQDVWKDLEEAEESWLKK